MKNILFVLSLILWCSCSNDMLETIESNEEIMTRATSSDGYYFDNSSNTQLTDIVAQDNYTNNSYITAEKLSLGCFKIKVSTQYPVMSGTVFFVYYSTFNGKDTGSAFTMLTVLPGESNAFVTIDHSKEEMYGNHFSITMTDAKCYPDRIVDKYNYVININNSGLR